MPFESIETGITRLHAHEEAILRFGQRTLGAGNGALFSLDFYVVGAIKRALGVTAGFITLVEARNFLCAAALLRMQLETAIRFHGLSLVSDPNAAASSILGGTRINELKCRDGNLLRDRYLVDRLSVEYPWVRRVYKETSKYVHFTERQIFAAMVSTNDDDRSVQLHISSSDDHAPDSAFIEAIEAFDGATTLLGTIVESWRRAKDSRAPDV